IPTNVISITDGQIFLETGLFNSGVRPAINVGQSVSRVGGNAQVRAMRKVAGTLRLSLSQFRDLEAFAAFASDLDAASRVHVERGARLVELLKQPQYAPYPVEEQVVSIWSGTTGQLDDVPTDDIGRFEAEFLDYLRRDHAGLLTAIRETKDLSDDNINALKDAIGRVRPPLQMARRQVVGSARGQGAALGEGEHGPETSRTGEVTGGQLPVSEEEQVEGLGEDEHGQEAVARYAPPAPAAGE